MAELGDVSREITELFGRKAEGFAWVSFALKVTAAVCSCIIVIATFSTYPWLHYAAVAAAGIVLISALVLLGTEADASKALARARVALDIAQKQKSESEAQDRHFAEIEQLYDTELERLSHLQAGRDLIRTILEDVACSTQVATDAAVIDLMLSQAKRSLFLAHGFKMNEHYTVCVFESMISADTNKVELCCVAHLRAIDCDIALARKWAEGVGVAGTALARKTEIVVPDLKAPELGSLYDTPEKKTDDDTRYRSIVAEPIRLNDGELWGILCATTSKPGHFNLSDRSYVDVTQSLAGMISLAIKINRAKSAGHSSSAAI